MAVVKVGIAVVVLPVTGGDIDLAADDRLDPGRAAGLVKSHRAVHHAVVGDGQRRLSQRLGFFRELCDAAGAVDVQMHKGHGYASFPSKLMIFLSR